MASSPAETGPGVRYRSNMHVRYRPGCPYCHLRLQHFSAALRTSALGRDYGLRLRPDCRKKSDTSLPSLRP